MNFDNINVKYPNSWNLFQEWWNNEYPQFDWLMCQRELYDFFDEQEITGEVKLSYDGGDNKWFEYEIYDEKFVSISSMDEPDYCEPYKTKTRSQAEEQMFLKEFEILESKL